MLLLTRIFQAGMKRISYLGTKILPNLSQWLRTKKNSENTAIETVGQQEITRKEIIKKVTIRKEIIRITDVDVVGIKDEASGDSVVDTDDMKELLHKIKKKVQLHVNIPTLRQIVLHQSLL